jgi:Mor family transcriptional regulator
MGCRLIHLFSSLDDFFDQGLVSVGSGAAGRVGEDVRVVGMRLFQRHVLGDRTSKYQLAEILAQRSRNELIRLRYAAGETISELARAFGISPQRVYQIVNFKAR